MMKHLHEGMRHIDTHHRAIHETMAQYVAANPVTPSDTPLDPEAS
jgi:hypothetical protein